MMLLLLLLMLVARSGCGHVRPCSVHEGVRVWVVVVHCTAQCLGSLDQRAVIRTASRIPLLASPTAVNARRFERRTPVYSVLCIS
jgi:hypothetical protein